jgi:hypothetical protein
VTTYSGHGNETSNSIKDEIFLPLASQKGLCSMEFSYNDADIRTSVCMYTQGHGD